MSTSIEMTDARRVFDGVNETATQIYLIIHERLQALGLFEALDDSWVARSELQRRLDVPAGVFHRFSLAIDALGHLGVLDRRDDDVRVRTASPPPAEVDSELIAWTFGPLLTDYLELYRSGLVFDPTFSLAFDENMAEIWDGLLNAPINLLPRDMAVNWVSTPGGRVLDLAFGTPYTLRQLAAVNGEVCALEISAHFVDRARAELADVGAVTDIVQADVNDGLGMFEADSFDGVMFMGALHFVHDPAALAEELARVLREGKRLAVGMFFTDRPCYAAPAFQLHRTLFDPPGVLRSEAEVIDAFRRSGFELDMTLHLGSYCSHYLQHRPAR